MPCIICKPKDRKSPFLQDMSNLPQMHLLSMRLEENLHKECPSNCKDWISWLPECIALHIFSYLDPGKSLPKFLDRSHGDVVGYCYCELLINPSNELGRSQLSSPYISLCAYRPYVVYPSFFQGKPDNSNDSIIQVCMFLLHMLKFKSS